MLSQELLGKLIAELATTKGTEVDPEAAVAFASRFGDVNVMTFEAGRGVVHPSEATPAAAIEFISRHAGDDLYFDPAKRRDSALGKGRKSDYLGSEWVWVDIDPPKGMVDPMALSEWAQTVLEQVAPLDIPEPQIIVSSGRGLWLYWQLPFVHPASEVEAINRGLAEKLGGDHVYSIDHVARLPFTRNGKTGQLARVLHQADGLTDPAALPVALQVAAADEEAQLADLPPARPIQSLEEFHDILDRAVSEEDRDRLQLAALDPTTANQTRSEPLNVADRSAVMFSWVLSALNAGLPAEVVRDCIISPVLGPISAHILDPKKVPVYARERYAARQVENALKKLGPLQGRASGQPSPEPEPEPAPTVISLAPIPANLPPRPWLVDGFLMEGQVTMVTGKGGEGKSLLALQVGAMIALGQEFAFWRSRTARNVLLLNGEDDVDELRRRLWGVAATMDIDPQALDGRLLALRSPNLVLLHRNPETGRLETTELYRRLEAIVRESSVGALIIDPLVETHVNLDENSNGDMKELVVKLRELARRLSIPILIVHHSRKGAGGGGDQDAARGGSALVNACRTVVTLERMTGEEHARIHPPLEREKYVRVSGAKANYAGRLDDRWLEIRSVQLPNGDWSPVFTSVVFGDVSVGFDVDTWQHREALLTLVRRGTGTRPWSTSQTGPKAARLDSAVASQFGLDLGQSRRIIDAYAKGGIIVMADWKSPSRDHGDVWTLKGEPLPPHTQDIPF